MEPAYTGTTGTSKRINERQTRPQKDITEKGDAEKDDTSIGWNSGSVLIKKPQLFCGFFLFNVWYTKNEAYGVCRCIVSGIFL